MADENHHIIQWSATFYNREAVDTEGLDTGGKSEIRLEVGEQMG